MKHAKYIFILFLLNINLLVKTLIVGSTTAVAVQGSTLFPNASGGGANNEMLGFYAFTGGVTLTDATTMCLFNDYFPVYGTITPNGGLFNLGQNLFLGSNAVISNGGLFNGNGYAMSLPETVQTFSFVAPVTFGNTDLYLNSN